MSIINKIEHIFLAVLTTLAMTATLTGCVDDLIDESVDIPNAEVEIRGEVIYKPLVPMKVQTRATEAPEGTKFTGIKSLYVFFFDSEMNNLVEKYSGPVGNLAHVPSESSTQERVTFKKKVKAGKYYVYAVVNVPADKLAEVKTIEQLRKFKLTWDSNIENDLEMFGVFKIDNKESPSTPKNDSFEKDALITITPDKNNLLSWVCRAVSKVTVDFNGDKLKEGVTVYIKDAVLKNLTSGAFLGADSRIDSEQDTFQIAKTTDYSITYGNGEEHQTWPKVTKSKTFKAKEIWPEAGIENFHDDNAKALPCYENMQGTHDDKDKRQDKDGDGIIDSEVCDGVENGTYLEVKGYYVADVEGYKSQGDIIYRFMLGQDAKHNFDLIRNHHYKITMNFRDYGNDVDWHIEYSDQYFDVSFPEDVNYQGKFFVPSAEFRTIPNGGHDFSNQNEITVTSFKTNGSENVWIEPDIDYTYYEYDFRNDSWNPVEGVNWLEKSEGDPINNNTQKKYTFVASKTDSVPININEKLRTHPAVSGSETSPYNLSNKSGGMNVENTANCYIVGAPGWYCFPLVYGNAIKDGSINVPAYASPNIVNHLNKNITNPYIKENGVNISKENVSVEIIWKDDQYIVYRKTDRGTLEYDETLFNGKGGIKFYIDPGKIKECNFVIALIDKSAKEDELVKCERNYWPYNYLYEEKREHFGSTKAIWSWHIWVTRFGFEEEEFARDISVLNHERKEFDVMPVNLGWCSDKELIYYKPRKCDITFTVGDLKIQRTIIQYPHLLLPRGNHPYYQWGRKDPFVGTNQLWTNKRRWSTVVDPNGEEFDFRDTSSASNPTFLYYNEPEKERPGDLHRNDRRKNTIDCLAELVKNPDKWHNCKHASLSVSTPLNYFNINVAPSDLWLYNNAKTVYDPCPPGYEVGRGVFTGFTTDGGNQTEPRYWYDVLERNMEQDYYGYEKGDREKVRPINGYVIDVYTDTRKLQSITFPITGYRDWDAKADVIHYPPTRKQYDDHPGQNLEGRGFAWTSEAASEKGSYYLAFCRKDIQEGGDWLTGRGGGDGKMWINPRLEGPNTDGYAVRPVSSK